MTYGVKDVCKRYACGEHTVLGWITAGELKAINTARVRNGKRPRWRITAEALAEFEASRTTGAGEPKLARRRKKQDTSVVKFYPE